jgi:hypothetical protein
MVVSGLTREELKQKGVIDKQNGLIAQNGEEWGMMQT